MSTSTTELMQHTAKPFSPVSGVLQRKCACGNHTIGGGQCTECGKNRQTLQRKTQNSRTESSNAVDLPPIVHDVLHSPGQPLDAASRNFFEPRFGQDFSHVRLHTDTRASESARTVNALAYTVGSHVAVRSDKHEPGTAAGRHLLAHELAHVVQQSGGVGGGDPESRADVAAQKILGGQPVNAEALGSAQLGLYRQHDEANSDGTLLNQGEFLDLLMQAFRQSFSTRSSLGSKPGDPPKNTHPARLAFLDPLHKGGSDVPSPDQFKREFLDLPLSKERKVGQIPPYQHKEESKVEPSGGVDLSKPEATVGIEIKQLGAEKLSTLGAEIKITREGLEGATGSVKFPLSPLLSRLLRQLQKLRGYGRHRKNHG